MSLGYRERQRLMRLVEGPVEAKTGSWYPCKQRDIEDYRYFSSMWRGFHYEAEDVLIEFTRSILKKPSSTTRDALDRLMDAVREPDWGPDIVIKAMHDIDTAFFGGVLRGKVIVRWENSVRGRRVLGSTCYRGEGRSKISLDANGIFVVSTDAKECMWSTFIHEGVVSHPKPKNSRRKDHVLANLNLQHAYINATCGDKPRILDKYMGWKDGHGWVFRWLINLVFQRAEKYLGFSITKHGDDMHCCLLCTARSDLVPPSVAAEYLRVHRRHCHFCPRAR